MDETARIDSAMVAQLAAHRGETLSKKAQSDLDWWLGKQRQQIGEDFLANLPKKVYCDLSGRQVKVINEQAERYGLAISGRTIDMYAAVASFHDFLADIAHDFAEDDDLKKEKLRKEIAVLERRARVLDGDIQQQKAQFIPRADLHKRLTWLVKKLQTLGEQVGKIGGKEAQRTVNEFLESIAEEIEHGHLSVKE